MFNPEAPAAVQRCMRVGKRAVCLLVSALGVPSLGSASVEPSAEDAAIVHALNRLGYGPRPGDVERVRTQGLARYVDDQLHPERLPDRGLGGHLAGLRTLTLSSADLIRHYELPAAAKKELAERKAALGENASEEDMRQMRRDVARQYGTAMEGTGKQVVGELQQAKILRALYSEKQLDEVLVDFWMNHFNVYADKGQDKFLVGEFERQVVRPRAFGTFEDLLKATAASPAMLFYLDNWLSADPNAPPLGRRPLARRRDPSMETRPAQDKKRGLNENYAREVMELHTLGVDGGYTQKDVTEVARCFTGWTIRGLRPGARGGPAAPEFVFVPAIHDRGDKVVLGHRIQGGGKEEGDAVLHILATQPATARFVSLKLARRFVADDPPAALVDRAAETFRRTDGDIRAVVATIVTSREFAAGEARAAKVKTPLDFVVSSVRALGADVSDASDLARRIDAMGMPLYRQQPPTGYKDTADAWVSTGGLLARLNFALDLAAGKVGGVAVRFEALAPGATDPRALTEALALRLVPGGLSVQTRKTLDTEGGAGLSQTRVAGLILGSPEFQRK
jgi:uncharacterized protein (DUF1800 family)